LEPAVAASGGAAEVVDIARSRFALTGVSATFHGRDVFAPVAAALAAGRGLSEVGSEVEPSSLVVLERTRASRQDRALVAHVQYIDQFGNLQLDGDAQDIAWVTAAGPVAVVSSAWDRPPLAVSHGTTFADVSTGELVLYEDAHRRPAIAVNRGSAAERLGLGVGDELQIAPMDVAASD
jgi:S-adenosylmethionine hydrolase